MTGAARFPGLELRTGAAELRAAAGRRLEGYAATFHVETRIADAFTEVLVPGCFRGNLDGRDIVALADHDPAKVLGRTRTGSLALSENGKGLFFTLDVAPTSAGDDVLALVRSGDAGGCSFGFTVAKDGERWSGKRRELRAVTLHEISIVSAWPAYSGTTVAARARDRAEAEANARLRRMFLETL